MENRIFTIPDDEFISLIKNSSTISEVLFKLGYSVNGNSKGFHDIKERMKNLNLDSSSFKGKSVLKDNKNQRIDISELFTENSKHNRNVIRNAIIREKLLPYKCSICGLTEWNNKSISLELDHINGIRNDNRLENLRFLCPNCHSQTETYGSKNIKLKHDVKFEDISDDLKELIKITYLKEKSIKRTYNVLNIKQDIINKVLSDLNLKKINQHYVIRYNSKNVEIKRYGSLVEAAKDLINNNETKSKRVKTVTRTLMRNKDNFWLNSFWKII